MNTTVQQNSRHWCNKFAILYVSTWAHSCICVNPSPSEGTPSMEQQLSMAARRVASLSLVGYLHWKLKGVYFTDRGPLRSISARAAARCSPLYSMHNKVRVKNAINNKLLAELSVTWGAGRAQKELVLALPQLESNDWKINRYWRIG